MEDKKLSKQSLRQSQKNSKAMNTKRTTWRSAERSWSQGNLWVDSPCSMNYTNKLPAVDKVQRFAFNSIYNRDDPFKPAKIINEFLKPDTLVLQFRRSIREVDKISKSKQKQLERERNDRKGYYKVLNDYLHKKNTISRNNLKQTEQFDFRQIDKNRFSTDFKGNKEKEIVDRLCPKKPKLLQMQYDKYGNRSSYYANQNQIPQIKRKTQKKNLLNSNFNLQNSSFNKTESFFTDSERLDMAKPQNFNPGPGSYFQTPMKKSEKKVGHKNTQSEGFIDELSIENSKYLKVNYDEIMNDSLEDRQQQISEFITTINVDYQDNFESDGWEMND